MSLVFLNEKNRLKKSSFSYKILDFLLNDDFKVLKSK